MRSQHQNLRTLRCPFQGFKQRIRSFDLIEEFEFTQKGSPAKGKSTSGLSAISPQESEIREEKGNDQPPMLQIEHWFWYPEHQRNGLLI